MKSKRKSLLPLFIAVIVSTQIMFVDAKTPILEVSATNIYLQAGQENHIQIKFKNTGDSSIYNIEALLVSETPGSQLSLTPRRSSTKSAERKPRHTNLHFM